MKKYLLVLLAAFVSMSSAYGDAANGVKDFEYYRELNDNAHDPNAVGTVIKCQADGNSKQADVQGYVVYGTGNPTCGAFSPSTDNGVYFTIVAMLTSETAAAKGYTGYDGLVVAGAKAPGTDNNIYTTSTFAPPQRFRAVWQRA